MAKGSEIEDVAEMIKKVIIVATLKSNLYIFPSIKIIHSLSVHTTMQKPCHQEK